MVAIAEKPFIHLIQMPYGWYVYDVNRNRVLKVDEKVFKYLYAEQNDDSEMVNNLCEETKDKVQLLREKGFLSSSHPEEICHPMNDYLDSLLSKNIEKITLQVTRQCNLRCQYCIYSETNSDGQRTHSSDTMSWETAKKAIDFFAEHSYEERTVNVGFYGGEPLLAFDLIEKCVAYAEDVLEGKVLSFSLTSNGTLLTPAMVAFMEEHSIDLTISLDGPSEIHNKRRVFRDESKGTFEKLMGNLEWMKRDFPNFFNSISISAVLDPEEDFGCVDEFFKKFTAVGDRALAVISTIADDTYSDKKNLFSEEFQPRVNYELFNVLLAVGGRFAMKNLSPIAKTQYASIYDKFEQKPLYQTLLKRTAPGGPCPPGKTRLFVDVFGNMFPCERVSETADCMKIGHVNTGLNAEKAHNLLNIGALTAEECKKCFAFWNCIICSRQCAKDGCLDADTKRKSCLDSKLYVDSDLRNYITTIELKGDFAGAYEEAVENVW